MNLRRLSAAALISLISGFAIAQELGPLQTYGADGRLFSSSISSDYFLLSRQSYITEDSSGYGGDVRIVRKYEGGGFEIILKQYTARCAAPFDNSVQIIWSDPGDEANSTTVNVANAGRSPGADQKDSYNLYWAACKGQFRKFK